MIDFLIQNSDKFAYLAGTASVLSFLTILIFFAVGGIFGPINDAISVFQFLFLVPVALALYRLLNPYAQTLSFIAAALGITAMLIFAILQALLVFRQVRFEQTFTYVLLMTGTVGVWWLIVSIISLTNSVYPTGLAWVGITAGAASILVLIGFWIGGQQHPLAIIGFLIDMIAIPLWAFWMGKTLSSLLTS